MSSAGAVGTTELLLRSMARHGGGRYFAATSEQEIIQALREIAIGKPNRSSPSLPRPFSILTQLSAASVDLNLAVALRTLATSRSTDPTWRCS